MLLEVQDALHCERKRLTDAISVLVRLCVFVKESLVDHCQLKAELKLP